VGQATCNHRSQFTSFRLSISALQSDMRQRAERSGENHPRRSRRECCACQLEPAEARSGLSQRDTCCVSNAYQGSAFRREGERQCVDPDGDRERRMYSVSALNNAAIRRSLSFSSLSSAMESAMFSTLLRSRCRICGWQSEGGRLNFIALPTRLPLHS
jgi:hypothetical protein